MKKKNRKVEKMNTQSEDASSKREVMNIRIDRDTALKHLKTERAICNKLCQLMAQGKLLSSLNEDSLFDLSNMLDIGDIINEIAEGIYYLFVDECIIVEKELRNNGKWDEWNMDKEV